MKVLDIMMGTPYQCRPETNLGTATEFMWRGNCGFLPVVGDQGKIVGVITDRDVCIALGTRSRPAGEVMVAEVMSKQVYSCSPDDDIHAALKAMRDGHVRRLAVVAKDGSLVGVISIDDIVLHSETPAYGEKPALSNDEVIRTFQVINVRQLPQAVAKRAAVA